MVENRRDSLSEKIMNAPNDDTVEREMARRERCPRCGSKRFHVNHYLREHHHGRVYLECSDCGNFTARLIVHAYVDPDHFHSFLQKIKGSSEESGRKIGSKFEVHAQRAIEQSKKVKELAEEYEAAFGDSEKTIRELYNEYNVKEDG